MSETESEKFEGGTLPLEQEGEEQMPEMKCVGCGRGHLIIYHGYPGVVTGSRVDNGVIQGVLICHSPVPDNAKDHSSFATTHPCNAKTVFEITGSSVSFLPGKLFEGDLRQDVSKNARIMFEDALLCFYGSSYRGVVAMCRGALEEALAAENIHGSPKDDLQSKIEAAKPLKVLGDEEISQAHGARLIGNRALHGAMSVSQSQAQITLGTTVELLNHIIQHKPSASQ